MTKDIERRAVVVPLEVRASGGKKKLIGYAALYNERSSDLGGFTEVIRPGAFDRAIRENQECLARAEHDTRLLLGRRSSGTLRLEVDSKGLRYEVDVPDTQVGRDLMTLVERGDIKGSSFAFMIPHDDAQKWTTTERGTPLRELLDLDIFDVAPTADPAYPTTSVSARALERAKEMVMEIPKDAEAAAGSGPGLEQGAAPTEVEACPCCSGESRCAVAAKRSEEPAPPSTPEPEPVDLEMERLRLTYGSGEEPAA